MVLAVTVSICARPLLPTPPPWERHTGGGRRVCQPGAAGLGRVYAGQRWGGTCAKETLPTQRLGEFSAEGAPTGVGGMGPSPETDSTSLGEVCGGDPSSRRGGLGFPVRAVRPRRGRCLGVPLTPLAPGGLGHPVSHLSPAPAPSPSLARRDHLGEPTPRSRSFLHQTERAA